MTNTILSSSDNSNPNSGKRPLTTHVFQHVLVGDKVTPISFGRRDIPTGKCTPEATKRISRSHCKIEWNEGKSLFNLKVLGANGIRIQGRLYTSTQEVVLSSGSIIDFVGFRVMFLDPETSIDSETLLPSKKTKPSKSPKETSTANKPLSKPRNATTSKKSGVESEENSFSYDVSTSVDGSHSFISNLDGLDSFSKEKSSSKKSTTSSNNNGVEKDTASVSSEPTENKTKPSPNPSSNSNKKPTLIQLTQSTSQPEDEAFINLVLHKLIEMDKRTPVALVSLFDELHKVYQPTPEIPEEIDFTLDFLSNRLAALPMFVHVPTLGNTELLRLGQYYYEPSLDWNTSRSFEVGTVVRKPRGCTLSSKQYYFKPIPKNPKSRGTVTTPKKT